MDEMIWEAGIGEDVSAFIYAIRSTKEYKTYEYQKEKVKMFPEIKERLDEYRKGNYELQSLNQGDDLLEKLENFQNCYEEFLENPLVTDFLQAELDFCRLMQTINVIVTEALDFE